MDEFVKAKLGEWNLRDLIPTFEENEIDEEAFQCLTVDVIATLIPKLGPQMKFRKYHEAERNLSLASVSLDSNLLKSIELADLQQLPIEIELPIAESSTSSPKPTNIIYTEPDKPAAKQSSKVSAALASGSEATLTPTDICEAANLRIVDIRGMLERSIQGKVVLQASGRGSEKLSDKHQLMLAGAVISEEINNAKDYLISSKRLTQLAESIKVVFPKETVASYYVPFKLNKITKTKVLAKGKLYDKYCTYRALLRRSGVIVTESNAKNGGAAPKRPVVLASRQDFDQSEEEQREELQEQLQWLQNCIQPWPTVEEYWKATSKTRVNQLICSTEVSAAEYLSTYKALCQPLGYNLVDIDFTCMYPDKTLQLYAQWPDFVDEILHYCKISANINSQVKKCVAEIDVEYVDNNLTDSTTLMVLRLIPLLLPCPSIRVPKKPHWRPSKIESQDGLFLHVLSASHLETELTSRSNKLAMYGLSAQPLPVAVGDSITNINSWYVCINHLRYKV